MAKTKKQTDKGLLASILLHLRRMHLSLRRSPNTWQTLRDSNIYEPTLFRISLVPSLNNLAQDVIFVGESAQKLKHPLAKDIVALSARLDVGMFDSWDYARDCGAKEQTFAQFLGQKEVNNKIIEGYITTYEKEKDALLDLIGKISAELSLEKKEPIITTTTTTEKVAHIIDALQKDPNVKAEVIAADLGVSPGRVRQLWKGPRKQAQKRNIRHGSKNNGKTETIDESVSCSYCSDPIRGSFECNRCMEVISGQCKSCHWTNNHPDDALP